MTKLGGWVCGALLLALGCSSVTDTRASTDAATDAIAIDAPGFVLPEWPATPSGGDDRRLVAMVLVFVLFVAALLLPFLNEVAPVLPRW